MEKVLVIDDQPALCATLGLMLRQAGYEVIEAGDGVEGTALACEGAFDLVLTDLRLGGETTGIDVLRSTKEARPLTEVIVMTAYGTVESAVEAMRLGASDFLQKPFRQQELLLRVERALARRRMTRQLQLLTEQFREQYGFDSIVGRSDAIRTVLGRVLRVAPTNATILITGESGTGKELVAKAVHASSKRSSMPYVSVNCAAITETLLESELFGHVKGAFTGAVVERKGLFEEASGGTFFLDEIAETTPQFQAKLLRVIEANEVRRVGGNQMVKVDVRIVAATNRNLEEEVAKGSFREDLYYRLNVVRVRIPPLRERREDVPMLAQFFIDRINRRDHRVLTIDPGALEALMERNFPGNVRELNNLVEQAAALSEGSELTTEDFNESNAPSDKDGPLTTLVVAVETAERRTVERALRAHGGNRERAAASLGVSVTTLWRKMKTLNVEAG